MNELVFIPIPKKGNAKECSNYHTVALISHASKVMLKILQARLQQYMNVNFLMFKLDLEKAEEPEIKLPTSIGSLKRQESSTKTSTSALLTMPKPLTMWITTKCGKFWRRWEFLSPEKPVYRSRSNSSNQTWNNGFAQNWERSTAAAAESLQSCLTLCDPIDGSPPGSPVPGILQARTLEWVASAFCNAWKWKVKVKSLSHVSNP